MSIELQNLEQQNEFLVKENQKLKELHQTYQIEFANYEEQIIQYEALLTEREVFSSQPCQSSVTVSDPQLERQFQEIKLKYETCQKELFTEQEKGKLALKQQQKYKSQIEKLIDTIKDLEKENYGVNQSKRTTSQEMEQLSRQVKQLEGDKKTLSDLLSQSHAKCSKMEFEVRRSNWKEQETTQDEWKLEKETKFLKAEVDRLKNENTFLKTKKTQKMNDFVADAPVADFATQMRASSNNIRRLMQ
ncbi:hypothetical protein SS50377_20783 [Spironucleus salmonicida]|uniref:Uncharacterized protein n=1 Tax=Spironucleus salmonicida TaxID=348837 RepID=V6LR74_9EUKA|nr:hypothetical protein SS50377_20783 [Spironucleus salmonicida]|eukprot:EST47110.1 hypothetical protein SS50377_12816 [Spironucleus salmonicida]